MKSFFLAFALLFSAMFSAQKTDASVTKLYQNYLTIKNALAADDAALAKISAKNFLISANVIDFKTISEGNISVLKKDAAAIYEASDLKTQRSFFYNLSGNMIALSGHFKFSDSPVFILTCPMANGEWLSAEKQILNPYYGSEMLHCGSVKSEIK